jgi:hypothetical protein
MGTTNNVFINIKDLPEIQQVNNGDYLVVETQDGTSIIDFQNFIIGSENNGLTVKVEANATDIAGVSAATDSALQALSSNILSTLNRIYYGKTQVIISNGTEGIGILSPRPPVEVGEILPDDVIIIPANDDAAKYMGYATLVDNTEDNRGVVYVTGRFKKTKYSFSADVAVPLTNTDVVSLNPNTSLSAYTPGHLVDRLTGRLIVNPLAEGEGAPSILVEEIDSTANELGLTVIYNVIVVKPY